MLQLWISRVYVPRKHYYIKRTSLRACYQVSIAKAVLKRSITTSFDRTSRGQSERNETTKSSELKYVYLVEKFRPKTVFFYPYAAVVKHIYRSGSSSKKGFSCCGSTRYHVGLQLSSHNYRAKRPLAFVKANTCVLL